MGSESSVASSGDRLRDRVWLWGHPAGAAEGSYAVPAGSRLTPVEGVHWFGARNVYFVPWVRPMDLEHTTTAADHLGEVGWSVEHGRVGGHGADDEIGRILELAQGHPVIGRVVYDDFFAVPDGDRLGLAKPYRDYTPQRVAARDWMAAHGDEELR